MPQFVEDLKEFVKELGEFALYLIGHEPFKDKQREKDLDKQDAEIERRVQEKAAKQNIEITSQDLTNAGLDKDGNLILREGHSLKPEIPEDNPNRTTHQDKIIKSNSTEKSRHK